MGYLIFDLVIAAVLVLFLCLGARRGLLLSLCGLVVTAVSFFGAGFLADTLTPPVANWIEPKLESAIQETLDDALAGPTEAFQNSQEAMDALRDRGGLYAWAADAAEEPLQAISATLDSATIASLAAGLASKQIAHNALFVLCFVVLCILLNLLLHALDLVAKLPGLHFCNKLGGAVIGAVKGVLILFVAVTFLQVVGWLVTPEAVEHTYLLRFFVRCNPILSLFRV